MRRYLALVIIGAGFLFGFMGSSIFSKNTSTNEGAPFQGGVEVGSAFEGGQPNAMDQNLYPKLLTEKDFDSTDPLWIPAGYTPGVTSLCPTEQAAGYVPEDRVSAGFVNRNGSEAVHVVSRYSPGIVQTVLDAYKTGAENCGIFSDDTGSGSTEGEIFENEVIMRIRYDDSAGSVHVSLNVRRYEDLISIVIVGGGGPLTSDPATRFANLAEPRIRQ